jgi:hypothetical protein
MRVKCGVLLFCVHPHDSHDPLCIFVCADKYKLEVCRVEHRATFMPLFLSARDAHVSAAGGVGGVGGASASNDVAVAVAAPAAKRLRNRFRSGVLIADVQEEHLLRLEKE